MTWSILSGDCLERLADLDDDSIEAVVTDPPYGLSAEPDAAEVLGHWLAGDDYQHRGGGFMGKTWDSFVPGPTVWRECLRVLKPGGHLCAFFGTRTVDLGGMAIRLAGFEIRDCLAWHYGSGFPKSLDVSKAIDRRGGVVAEFAEFRDAVIAAMDKNGIKRKELEATLGNFMLSHYLTKGSQPAVPNLRDYRIIRDFVGLGDQFDELFQDEAEREVVGVGRSAIANKEEGPRHTVGASKAVEFDLTAPATDLARQWQGWGTALKPAFEPIILARKPLIGTVAENVTRYGTGALNVDGCRVGTTVETWPSSRSYAPGQIQPGGKGKTEQTGPTPPGRWPANLVLDDQAAAMLDEQSGEMRGQVGMAKTEGGHRFITGDTETVQQFDYGTTDTGGASRFFYQAKASRAERNAGLDGFKEKKAEWDHWVASGSNPGGVSAPRRNQHPTVKPIDLMRWLVRLVTPPGGTVLDPFTGSGTTGIAAGLEGFDFVGIEREAEYREIAEARLKWWAEQEGETAEILHRAGLAEKERERAERVGQASLFDAEAA